MPEQPVSPQPGETDVRERLRRLAALLRETHHLEPEAQEALAELVDDLGHELDPTHLAPEETKHLLDLVTQLTQALRHQHAQGLLAAVQARLEGVAIRAEAKAPLISGI